MKKFIWLLILFGSIINCYGNDVLIIANTLYYEARGESIYGQLAVASTIYNRSIERHLTPVQVCKQPKQFSCWNGNRKAVYHNNKIFERCMFIAESINRGSFIPIINSNHYYNPSLCSPSWGDVMVNKIRIGGHLFGEL